VLSWILLACIPVAAVFLRLLAGEDEPDNALVQVQEDEPRSDPDDVLAVAARAALRTTSRHASQSAHGQPQLPPQ
jgi:hypothetical protein